MLEAVEEHIQREVAALEKQRRGSVIVTVGKGAALDGPDSCLLCLRRSSNWFSPVSVVGVG
jgi:hypothetical protein